MLTTPEADVLSSPDRSRAMVAGKEIERVGVSWPPSNIRSTMMGSSGSPQSASDWPGRGAFSQAVGGVALECQW
jgi:hypothetical protein